MSGEVISYLIAGSFGLFLCIQYVAFNLILNQTKEAKKQKSDLLYIAFIGVMTLTASIFGLTAHYTATGFAQSILVKMRWISVLCSITGYVMLSRFILVFIKDMTFVETDEYKGNTRKYLFVFRIVTALIGLTVLLSPFVITEQSKVHPIFGWGLVAYFITFSLLEFFEFKRMLKKETGKISPINRLRFTTILWSGIIPFLLAAIELGLRIVIGDNWFAQYGSIYMYGSFILSLGLSFNLIFEYMEVLNRITETNRKLSDLNKKIMDEVRTAQSLQISLLPIDKQREIQKTLDMEISYMPMQSVGGDYYDFYQLDENQVLMLLGDASGHGIYAAMIWAMLKVEVEELIEEKHFYDIAHAFTLLNKRITRILENTYSYATLFCCLINLEKKYFSYISAGHTDQLYYSKKDNSVVKIKNKNPIIGSFKNAKYNADTISNNEGDVILLFTDGVMEGVNPLNEQVGITRMENIFLDACNNGENSSIILSNVLSEIEEFCEGTMQHDDRTLMIIKL